MAFDYFTQPRGPEIDIDLFSRAANAGIQGGRANPTALTSGIQGFIEGVDNSLGMIQKSQQIQENQQQLEQAPIRQEILLEELKSREIANDIAAKKRDAMLLNEDTLLKTQELEAENQYLEAKQLNEDINSKQQLITLSQSALPEERKKVFTDPKFTGLLFRDVKFTEGLVQKYASDGTFTDQEAMQAYKRLDFMKVKEYELQKERLDLAAKESVIGDWPKISANFKNDAAFAEFTRGMSDADLVDNKKFAVVPFGSVTYNNQTKEVAGPDPLYDPTQPLIAGQKPFLIIQNGRVVGSATASEADKYYSYRNSYLASDDLLKLKTFGSNRNNNQGSSGTTPTPVSTPQPNVQQQSAGVEGVSTPAQTPVPQPTQTPNPVVNRASAELAKLKNSEGWGKDSLAATQLRRKQELQNRLSPNATFQPSAYQARAQSTQPINDFSEQPPALSIFDTSLINALPTPSQAVSSVLKREAGVRLPAYTVSKETYQRVVSDPLLQSEPALIKGLAVIESSGNRGAKSPTGVRGLLQVTKDTASIYGMNRDIPEENVAAGKLYLADQLIAFKGNAKLALAAYNAGPGVLMQAVRKAQSTDWEDVKKELRTLLHPKKYKEVSNYPEKVLSAASRFVQPADRNFVELLNINGLVV